MKRSEVTATIGSFEATTKLSGLDEKLRRFATRFEIPGQPKLSDDKPIELFLSGMSSFYADGRSTVSYLPHFSINHHVPEIMVVNRRLPGIDGGEPPRRISRPEITLTYDIQMMRTKSLGLIAVGYRDADGPDVTGPLTETEITDEDDRITLGNAVVYTAQIHGLDTAHIRTV